MSERQSRFLLAEDVGDQHLYADYDTFEAALEHAWDKLSLDAAQIQQRPVEEAAARTITIYERVGEGAPEETRFTMIYVVTRRGEAT